MQVGKFITFSIVVLSIAIVVFNNLTQLVKEIFLPELDVGLWISFAMIIFGTTTYVVINNNMLSKGSKR